MADPLDFMSPKQLADAMDRSVYTLSYWRQEGRGPKWARIGRRVVYRRSDVERWLDDQFAQAEKGR